MTNTLRVHALPLRVHSAHDLLSGKQCTQPTLRQYPWMTMKESSAAEGNLDTLFKKPFETKLHQVVYRLPG
jgi:hypothetical protein